MSNQAAGAPRVYPVGRAVLLLGVCDPALAGRRIAVDGRRVQAMRMGRLALLLSFVDQASYTAEEIERKRCVRAAGPVVPFPLLTAFPHAADLEALARERYAKWSRSLTRLGPKRECVVHLYAGPHAPPGGEPYVLRVTQRATRATRVPAFDAPEPTLEHAQGVWQACTEIASATRRVRTAGRRGALWSGAFLVSDDAVEKLAGVLAGFSQAGAALGVTTHLEAPRAPFTFV